MRWKISKTLLDWIYPERCVFCDRVLGRKEKALCIRCRKKLPVPLGEPRCKCCSKPLDQQEKEYCYDCAHYEQFYERGLGIFAYEEPLKGALMGLKFKGRKEYGDFLGKLMLLYGASFVRQADPQVILPVPIHKKKLAGRGYNQAEVLAGVVSSGLSIPIRTDLVLRKKSTKAQKELDRKERRKNLQKAFTVRKEAGRYNSVLLIDDIYTTGATINAIAEKLRAQGVQKIYFLSLCIGKGF